MPPETTQAATESLIRRYFDAFNGGDTAAMLACLADNVIHDVNQGARRVGKAAFADFCRHMSETYEEELTGIAIMTSADGARAAAESNVNGAYIKTDEGLPPATGQKYQLPAGTFFAISDGRITRITTYYNLTDWLLQVAGEALARELAQGRA
jgi:steroid delta-isomerase-like uncharacterized protein